MDFVGSFASTLTNAPDLTPEEIANPELMAEVEHHHALFTFLRVSPSYAVVTRMAKLLAHRSANPRRIGDMKGDPDAFLWPHDLPQHARDRLIETYAVFGDVSRTMFVPWWREHRRHIRKPLDGSSKQSALVAAGTMANIPDIQRPPMSIVKAATPKQREMLTRRAKLLGAIALRPDSPKWAHMLRALPREEQMKYDLRWNVKSYTRPNVRKSGSVDGIETDDIQAKLDDKFHKDFAPALQIAENAAYGIFPSDRDYGFPHRQFESFCTPQ